MSEKRRKFEELEEEPTLDEGVAGGKRFHPVTMSPPTTTPVSQLDDPLIHSLRIAASLPYILT